MFIFWYEIGGTDNKLILLAELACEVNGLTALLAWMGMQVFMSGPHLRFIGYAFQ